MAILRRARVPLLLCGVLLASRTVVDGNGLMTVSVSPALSLAPSNVRVQIRVEPNAANRTLAVAADSGDFYRRSIIQMEGERAPATVTLRYDSLPGGDYEVVCVLMDGAGHERATAHTTLSVKSQY